MNPMPRASRSRFLMAAAALFAVGALSLAACKKEELSPEQARVRKGQTLYTLHCAACHNPSDPTRDGGLGPAIAGSSLELLQARVLRGAYPEGYTPKRTTHIMQKLPLGPEDVEALHAYLGSL